MMNNTYFTDGYYYALKRRAAKRNAKIVQKVLGATMVVLGLVSAIILKDGTMTLLAVPFGIYLILSRKLHVVY